MKTSVLLILAGLASGCSVIAPPTPELPQGVLYGAISHDPFWIASVEPTRILLTMGPEGGRADGPVQSLEYRGMVPSARAGLRRWQAGRGTQVIAIEARPGPCTAGGRRYEDRATIYLGGRTMQGCGGRELAGRG